MLQTKDVYPVAVRHPVTNSSRDVLWQTESRRSDFNVPSAGSPSYDGVVLKKDSSYFGVHPRRKY